MYPVSSYLGWKKLVSYNKVVHFFKYLHQCPQFTVPAKCTVVRFASCKVVSVDLREGKSEWNSKWRTVIQKTASYERF